MSALFKKSRSVECCYSDVERDPSSLGRGGAVKTRNSHSLETNTYHGSLHGTPVARNSCSRLFVSVVNLCALVNEWWVASLLVMRVSEVDFLFFIEVGRVSLLRAISKGASHFFCAVQIRNLHFRA